jgi:hypothetical protein
MKRRAFLKGVARTGGSIALAPLLSGVPVQSAVASTPFVKADETFLDELQRACFRFFWETTEPTTGLVPGRARADGSNRLDIASIASTGFGLTALCLAHQRGWQKAEEIQQRVHATLHFLHNRMPHEKGFYYHFVNTKNGQHVWNCEVSTIDAAILLCGVLTCRSYFEDKEIRDLADAIYARVDWPWLTDGLLIRHG